MPKTLYVAAPYKIILNPKFRALDSETQNLIWLFRGRVKLPVDHKSYYEKEFDFPYRVIESYRFDPLKISEMINKIEHMGFIEFVSKGSGKPGDLTKNIYKLSRKFEVKG